MNEFKTKVILDFLSGHNFSGDPKELLQKLISEDIETLGNFNDVESIEDRLKFLASLRGLSEPAYLDLEESTSGHTDGNRININANHPRSRQLFTWAHEIVHSYFEQSSGITTDCFGNEFHCSGVNQEEELLCDFGASLILFHGIQCENFDVNNLIMMMDQTGASAEAIVSSMLIQAKTDSGFIVWRRKCKKGENTDQVSLFGEELLQPFRIDYAISRKIYLPKNKSVNSGAAIETCETDGRSQGEIIINLGQKNIRLMTDNLKISGGRVLSLFQIF